MRLFFLGPRLLGGLVRPGISFGMPRWGNAQRAAINCDSVYVIEGATGHVKVGVSREPLARLAQLQTGSPFPLRLAFSIPTSRAYEVEQEAHTLLFAHRAEGEWFSIDKELAIAAVFGAASRLGVALTDDVAVASKPKVHWAIAAVCGFTFWFCALWWFGH